MNQSITLQQSNYYTWEILFIIGTRVRSTKVADYVLLLFIYFLFLFFFIHRSFSETTWPILTKFSGIVYSGVVWIIQ